MTSTLLTEKMLFVAPLVGIDPIELERIRDRLALREAQHRRTWPSPGSVELEQLIKRDADVLVQAYERLARVVERMPSS